MIFLRLDRVQDALTRLQIAVVVLSILMALQSPVAARVLKATGPLASIVFQLGDGAPDVAH